MKRVFVGVYFMVIFLAGMGQPTITPALDADCCCPASYHFQWSCYIVYGEGCSAQNPYCIRETCSPCDGGQSRDYSYCTSSLGACPYHGSCTCF